MTKLAAVDPDGIRISNRDFENIAVLSIGRAECTTPDASRRRLTRGAKSGLSDGMTAWVEVKDHGVSGGGCQGIWTESKSILANVDTQYGGECGGRKESEEGKSAHVEEWDGS
jgi:hypothetical protein